ncbi:MAG: hypothetical protein QOJ98_2966 [Acidobacteriota bacterium]|nr:hypothetical protein [Acidobacteriota bacterium]
MIAAAVIALLLAPLVVLRRRTLLAYYAVDAATWLFAFVLWQRLPAFNPWLGAIGLAVVKLATLSLFIANGSDVRWSANRAALLAAIVYAVALPVIGRHALDGDEPFYLWVTESMVQDCDLDLRNQYAAHGSGPQFNDPTGPNGEQYSRQEPFLSLLLVPGFALFGVQGALATIALFGVLLVRSTVRWMEDEGITEAHVRAVFPFFAFAPPVLYYAVRIWPEVPAAFFFVEAVRGVRNQRLKRWLPALFGLVMLKLRFALVAAGLVATMFRRRPRALAIGAAILAVPLAVLYFLTGSATNVHVWGELLPAPGERYVTGFFGILTDGMSGIPFQAPFYLFGLFALTRWRSTPRGFRTGIIAGSIYFLYLLPRPEWFGGWAPPLRYLVFLMPVLALGAASVWDRISRGAIAIAALWTIGLTFHGLTFPHRLFHIANGENAAGEWLSSVYRADFSRLFPSFIRMNGASWLGVLVVLIVIAIGVRRRRHDFAIPLFALVLAAGFAYAKKPGARVEFEDAHVVKEGGELYPAMYTMMRVTYRGGWILQAGQAISFQAQRGTHTLHAITGLGAAFEIGGHAYHIDPHPEYQRVRITIPEDGWVTLRCISGAINVDRMERR